MTTDATIALNNGIAVLLRLNNTDKYAIIDTTDYTKVSQYSWRTDPSGYVLRYIAPRKTEWLVKLITGKLYQDHKNRDTLDNRRCNLRSASASENAANQIKRLGTTSKFKGVCWDKAHQKWRAKITVNYKTIYLGLYDLEKEAALAYNNAAKLNFKEFANLNII